MNDPVAHQLADAVVHRGMASSEARHEAARRLLDVFSLTVASQEDPPVKIARSLVREGGMGATLWGTDKRYDVEDVALANGVGARYRDFNDAYFGREALHPSDMIPCLCAIAESLQAPMHELLDAICVAYDVAVDLADTWRTSSRGADHVNLILVGAVAGASVLTGLDTARTEQAIAVAVTSNVATRQTRRGHLTMWKGYAAAEQGVAALRAVRLAAAGVQGPSRSITGDEGFQAIAVDPTTWIDTWQRPGEERDAWRILDTHMKVYPLGYLGQAVAEVATGLHEQLGGERPRRVRVVTYDRAADIMADPEKWSIDSAETADHSLPWIAAIGLLDGRVDTSSMRRERWEAPDARTLLAAVTVEVDASMTARYPAAMPLRLEVETADGRLLADEVQLPRGHADRPLPDGELHDRAQGMMAPALGEGRAARIADSLLAVDVNRPVSTLLRC